MRSLSKAAQELAAHVGPHVKDMPPLEGFMTVPIAVDVRFQKWDKIMSMKAPDSALKVVGVYWHFARGMALAQGRTADAAAELKFVHAAAEQTPPDAVFAMPVNNKAKDVLTIADNVLGAKIALAKRIQRLRWPCCAKPLPFRTPLNMTNRQTGSFPFANLSERCCCLTATLPMRRRSSVKTWIATRATRDLCLA